MKKQLRAVFFGQVQGVGFRASVKNWADGLGLAGWVRNNPDGTVEVAAEGEEEDLRKFLQTINGSHLQTYISQTETTWKPSEGQYRRFEME